MSGIYIKGMEMPKNCAVCPCANDGIRFCKAANEYIPMIGHPKFCPLIAVPDHGRLIDADALLVELRKSNDVWADDFNDVWLGEMPTIIPANLRFGENPTIIPAERMVKHEQV